MRVVVPVQEVMTYEELFGDSACFLDRISATGAFDYVPRGYKADRESYHRAYLEALRQARLGRLQGCGERSILCVHGQEMVIRPAMCKKWSCPICGPRRAKWLLQNLKDNFRKWKCMLTLTLRYTGPESLVGAHARLLKAWHHLLVLLGREYGKLQFFWVDERQRNGMPHLHVLCSAVVDEAWLKGKRHKITADSYMCTVTMPKVVTRESYVIKYVTKSAARRESQREHLWGKSQGVPFVPYAGKGTGRYTLLNKSYWEMLTSIDRPMTWKLPAGRCSGQGLFELKEELREELEARLHARMQEMAEANF